MSTALAEPQALPISEPTFKLAGLREEPSRERLQLPFAEVVKTLFSQLVMISTQAIRSQNRESFKDIREKTFDLYVRLSIALGNVVLAKLDMLDLPGLIEASFESIEKECASKGKLYFAENDYREILFTISTLRSAHRWIPQLNSQKVPDQLRAQDEELARNYFKWAIWSQFHLDCLITALDKKEAINQEVLQELLDGLRGAVMAYAHVREALDLRNILSERYQDQFAVQWDNEDEALATAE